MSRLMIFLIHLDIIFQSLDRFVSGELFELVVILGLVEFEVIADRAQNSERHAVHIAYVTDGAAFHIAAESFKLKGDAFSLTSVHDKDVARRNSADIYVGAEVFAAFGEFVANLFVGGYINSLFVREPDFSSRFIESGAVNIVLNAVAWNNYVADNKVFGKASRDTRADNYIGLEEVDHNLGACGGVDLTSAALQKHNINKRNQQQ